MKQILARLVVPRAGGKIPAPEELPITEELRRWIAAHVPGLLELSGFDLALEVQRCLQYHRAHKPMVRYPLPQWYEVVKLRLLVVSAGTRACHAQALYSGRCRPCAARRGALPSATAPVGR